MDLDKILAISGKPGLYRLVSQSRNGAIVESLTDQKRFPVMQVNKVSALKDIAIYTMSEEVPLGEVFEKIATAENYGPAPSHKASANELRSYVEALLPEIDHSRVYPSDLKKLVQWYNILLEQGLISAEPAAEESTSEEEAEAAADTAIAAEERTEEAPAAAGEEAREEELNKDEEE